jgi:hypothetical protein
VALLSGTGGVGDSSRSSATVHSHRSAAGHASVRERIRSFDAASLSGQETRPAQQSRRSAPAQPRLRCLIKKWGQSRLSPISLIKKWGQSRLSPISLCQHLMQFSKIAGQQFGDNPTESS